MTRYEFPSVVAKDPSADIIVKNGSGQIFALADAAFSTPLTVYDKNGLTKTLVNTTLDGVTEEFSVDDQYIVWWRSGTWAFLIYSFTGIQAAASAAAASATSAANAAAASAVSAQDAASAATANSDSGIQSILQLTGGLSRAEVEAIAKAVGTQQDTADTFEAYRAVLFSNGTVKAVPVSVTPPAAPAFSSSSAGASLVTLGWGAVAGAALYMVYRNGQWLATTTNLSYRDRTGTTGQTYIYTVAAVNSYGMHSAQSAPVSLFLDPALNATPVTKVTVWPAMLPTSGSAIIRVNATDADAQNLALALNVSSGSIRPTQDPSVWILTI
jgi:hypothetical protein